MTLAEEAPDTRRTPPHDIDAEQATLGGMLLSPRTIRQVSGIIRPGDWYRPAHQVIYDAILTVDASGEPVDAISVNDELVRAGEGTRVGGAPYLHTLTEAIPTAANAGYYAKIVSDRAVLRRLVEVGTTIASLGWNGEGDLDDLVSRAQQLTTEVETLQDVEGAGLVKLDQVYQEVVDDQDATDEEAAVIPPYADLREVLPDAKPGQVVIIGARPAVGKSVLAADWARFNALHRGVGTAFFSLEMTRLELGQRVMAAEANVLLERLRSKTLEEADWQRVMAVKGVWDRAPLWMSDDFNISLPHMRSRLRKLTRTQKIDLVVVDYLQLMEGAASENRQQEISKISRGLKKLAKEFGVVVVVLSQLNRGSTQRSDKRPQISDLRESGSIEQDADVVILLDREDTRDKESPRAGEIDLLVEKNRNGAGGREVVCAFQGHYSRVVDMAGTEWKG
ncbi:replicative DNA helicase [Nocardiopsis alba]|uniref:Replicative DNA helicase n=1 Tax=Nocardiopsis alba TaxID=53437 RepID=A0A7K2IL44_9ACTN|nr:replicative DNA helicase [Nocardiopsis alba]MYR30692.1 replicative DNA helicase [Nocardiopsis alba]MYR30762.1 replicative DNA helicase [Nocardiopsis alba]